jgi:hypothetical protein
LNVCKILAQCRADRRGNEAMNEQSTADLTSSQLIFLIP